MGEGSLSLLELLKHCTIVLLYDKKCAEILSTVNCNLARFSKFVIFELRSHTYRLDDKLINYSISLLL